MKYIKLYEDHSDSKKNTLVRDLSKTFVTLSKNPKILNKIKEELEGLDLGGIKIYNLYKFDGMWQISYIFNEDWGDGPKPIGKGLVYHDALKSFEIDTLMILHNKLMDLAGMNDVFRKINERFTEEEKHKLVDNLNELFGMISKNPKIFDKIKKELYKLDIGGARIVGFQHNYNTNRWIIDYVFDTNRDPNAYIGKDKFTSIKGFESFPYSINEVIYDRLIELAGTDDVFRKINK
tara:strand:+ start:16455 stop:17159 length:705 start_codon:yes stop_codon:yes gene_type:complete